jgi:hypothetical protein
VQCTEADLHASVDYLATQKKEPEGWLDFLFSTGGAVATALILTFLDIYAPEFYLGFYAFKIGFPFVVGFLTFCWRRLWAKFKKRDPAALLPAAYLVEKEGVVRQTELGREQYAWDEILRLVTTDTHFFLLLTYRRVRVLPKRCFPDRASMNAFADAINLETIRRTSPPVPPRDPLNPPRPRPKATHSSGRS